MSANPRPTVEAPPEEGWQRLYVRSYRLQAPVEFARRWFLDQGVGPNAVPLSPRVRQSLDRPAPGTAVVRLDFEDGSSRTDLWEFSDPSVVSVTKRLEEYGRVQLWSRERYRFSEEVPGSRLDISSARQAVTVRARLALRLSLRAPVRPEADERAMCEELDRAYLARPSALAPASAR